MPAALADMSIESRWIVPMTARGRVLEDHSLIVRDGRIHDILPTAIAAERYAPSVTLTRRTHVLIPGFVDARTQSALRLVPNGAGAAMQDDRCAHDGVSLAIAAMLKSGVTCFGDVSHFPEATARAAAQHGIRAVIGMPIAEHATPWAANAAESLTQALTLRDEYRGHPLISTAFAPHPADDLSDTTLKRIATLTDELECPILIALHASAAEIAESVRRHGRRPIARLEALGLLTPALNAAHVVHITPAELDRAVRSGMSITLCPAADLRQGRGTAPLAALGASGICLGLGSDGHATHSTLDLWTEMKLLTLLSHADVDVEVDVDGAARPARIDAWDALAAASRGGATALGLEHEVGTLEAGKWADLCCLDLSGPSLHPSRDPVTQLVSSGGRDLVTDVWVAGRPLLSEGLFTRLDWPSVAAGAASWAPRLLPEGY